MKILEEFPFILSKARAVTEKTQEQISKEIGVSKNTISKWEHGELLPSKSRVAAIAKAYEIDEGMLDEHLKIAREENRKMLSFQRVDKRVHSKPSPPEFTGEIISAKEGRRTNQGWDKFGYEV